MILIIDGHSVAYRAYYAVPPLLNKKGIPTGVTHTFLNILLSLQKKYSPDKLIVTFDSKGKTKRHEMYEAYKANRDATPEDLIPQVEHLKEIIPLLGIPVLAEVGYEADDIIYTLTEKFPDEKCLIVTKDKDLHQMVSDRVFIIDYKKENPIGVEDVIEKFEVRPDQILDYLALIGDASDNIPGVKGIGPKTAVKLLTAYDTIDNIFEHVDELKGAVQKKIAGGKEIAYLSKKLATLEMMNHLVVEEPEKDMEKLEAMVLELELKSIHTRLFKNQPTEKTAVDSATEGEVDHPELLVHLDGEFFISDGKNYKIVETVKDIDCKWFFDYKNIVKHKDIIDMSIKDIMLISWLNNPDSGGIKKVKDESIGEFILKIYSNAAEEISKLTENGLDKIYTDIELPMLYNLAKMEKNGIKFSKDTVIEVEKKLDKQITDLEKEILSEIDVEEINLNSPKQLAEALFEKMGLKSYKKTKTGYSTSEEALLGVIMLNPESEPLIRKILNFRELRKLQSTYTLSLIEFIDENTGRIHSDFKQTGTATGRLSSQHPNLQNLPQKGTIAKEIRSAFIPKDGYKFISFDYSQIELRVLAHLTGDKNLTNAYKNDLDIHNITAKNIFNIEEADINSSIRRVAKAVNFGILYGLSAFGLSRDTGVPQAEAKVFIENYYNLYPRVKIYFTNLIENVKKTGFTETILGRKRFIKDINSKNGNLRNRGERMAMNAPIQGSASDIIKLAMIQCQEYIQNNNIDANIILQIHDELVFEVNENIPEKFFNDIKQIMESVIVLDIPLKVNGVAGHSLGELK